MRKYSIILAAVIVLTGVLSFARSQAQSPNQAGASGPAAAPQAPTAADRQAARQRMGGRDGIPPGPIPPEPPGFQRIKVKSTMDGSDQDAILVVPQRQLSNPRSLVVYLHGWSVTNEDRRPDAEAEAEKRGWLLLLPNFRGPYVNHCGNQNAQQDILDAIDWVKARYSVDKGHIYLVGFSGGGFLSMIMAYRYPDVWGAVSSWSGLSDILDSYLSGVKANPNDRYAQQMRTCFGGDPMVSPEVAAALRERSPITHFAPGVKLPPLDLNAQKDDPLVPVQQSLRAFKALAPGLLSEDDLEKFRRGEPVPAGAHFRIDPATGREIYLRREIDSLRVTIREGNHEMLSAAAFEWFDQFNRR